jgi:hypothetical protein
MAKRGRIVLVSFTVLISNMGGDPMDALGVGRELVL